jgi:hypothetical protein
MDNVANTNAHGGDSPAKPATPHDTTVKEAPAGGNAAVSRAPLNLGAAPAAAPPTAPGPATHNHVATGPAAAPPAAAPGTMPRAPAPQAPVRRPLPVSPPVVPPSARTTNCKTFFTKLHPGAINFLDEQISKWLRENPSIVVKHTNVTTGEIVDKKTEPNILITIWY